MATLENPTLVVFASDQGPGDAARTSIMSQVGSLLAKNGAKLVCLAENDIVPLPFLTSARAAGGEVELMCDAEYALPTSLEGITVQIIAKREARLSALAEMANCFIGLPGSLASVTAHYMTIAQLGAKTPMVFLNQNNAYEIVRGFSADVFVHTFQEAHRKVQFVENIEEIWPRVVRLLSV